MRNALICAGTMLALLLLWPVLFGGAAASTSAAAAAGSSTVTMRVPAPISMQRPARKKPAPAPSPVAPAPLAALPDVTPATESCRATLERARRLCGPGDSACLESASDAFDICEVRGVWPA